MNVKECWNKHWMINIIGYFIYTKWVVMYNICMYTCLQYSMLGFIICNDDDNVCTLKKTVYLNYKTVYHLYPQWAFYGYRVIDTVWQIPGNDLYLPAELLWKVLFFVQFSLTALTPFDWVRSAFWSRPPCGHHSVSLNSRIIRIRKTLLIPGGKLEELSCFCHQCPVLGKLLWKHSFARYQWLHTGSS